MDILIVEDNKELADLLCDFLRAENYTVSAVQTAEEALLLYERYGARLVVLDIMLPGLSGIEVCRRVRTESEIPIIMLTAKDDVTDKVAGLDMGADDYMTKPFSMVVLGKRITALLRRAGVKDEPNIWKYGELTVDFSGYSACNQNGKINITPKEIELLKLLLDHKGLVLSRSQILNAVWGDDSYVIDRIVDSYIRNLRKKLELNCIATVKGIGYKLEVDV